MTSTRATPACRKSAPVASTRSRMAPIPSSSFRAGMMMDSAGRLPAGIVMVKVNLRPRPSAGGGGAGGAQHAGRHAADHGVRRHVARHHRPGGYDGALSDMHPIRHHSRRAQPDIVFDDNAFSGDALVHKRSLGIIKDMVDGND